MALKKKAEVKTGKMVRELMLADKDVSASTIMVYSNNGLNEEIKIEGLHPKSNDELFLSGNFDWNDTVIYKIVDFSGKAEVGKVTLLDVKKNNITFQIQRIMWSKDKQTEETEETNILEATDEENSHDEQMEEKQNVYVLDKMKELQNSRHVVPSKPSQLKTEDTMVDHNIVEPTVIKQKAPVSNQTEHQQSHHVQTNQSINSKLQNQYQALVSHAIAVCQDYTLGLDVDDSMEKLKAELALQGVSLPLDSDIIGVVNGLRELKEKGMDLHKLLSLV
ncbi:hypothetical protein [Ectobacillus polymachus]|uniref:hypothetical protein n=1 Tax=Ectobacillus polymachus TaxID=1508806 RepID=UPI003A8BC96F